MDSRSDNNSLSAHQRLVIVTTRDCKNFAVLTCQSLTQHFARQVDASRLIRFNLLKVIPQICVAVRHTVSKVDIVLVISKCVCESETVELGTEGRWLFSSANSIRKVLYVEAIFMPANTSLLRGLIRVNWNFHSVVKKTVGLPKVKYCEFDCFAGSCVLDPKIEPLRVTLRIYVVLHHKIVLRVTHFLSEVQIPTFKSTFEKQSTILRPLQSVYILRLNLSISAEHQSHRSTNLRACILICYYFSLLQKIFNI
jgi:hypothetical protein